MGGMEINMSLDQVGREGVYYRVLLLQAHRSCPVDNHTGPYHAIQEKKEDVPGGGGTHL